MARSIKKGSVVVAVGTKKGGFLFHSPDRKKWSVAGPFMEGGAVYHMILDPRDGRTVYASAPMGSEPWGPAIYRGRAGEEPKATQASPKFKEGSDLSVSRVWHIEPGPSKTPDTIYAGVGPVRAQARLGRLRGRLPLPAESLWDLSSRTGRWSVDGSHEGPAVRFRISDRRASKAEAHRVRGALGRRWKPRVPEGPDGRLEDDEQRQSVAPFHEGFARPRRLSRGSPGRNGRR